MLSCSIYVRHMPVDLSKAVTQSVLKWFFPATTCATRTDPGMNYSVLYESLRMFGWPKIDRYETVAVTFRVRW